MKTPAGAQRQIRGLVTDLEVLAEILDYLRPVECEVALFNAGAGLGGRTQLYVKRRGGEAFVSSVNGQASYKAWPPGSDKTIEMRPSAAVAVVAERLAREVASW